MVIQKSEVVAKGDRQFEDGGRWKLADVHWLGLGYWMSKGKDERNPKNRQSTVNSGK
jgi:hypothetical protein